MEITSLRFLMVGMALNKPCEFFFPLHGCPLSDTDRCRLSQLYDFGAWEFRVAILNTELDLEIGGGYERIGTRSILRYDARAVKEFIGTCDVPSYFVSV